MLKFIGGVVVYTGVAIVVLKSFGLIDVKASITVYPANASFELTGK